MKGLIEKDGRSIEEIIKLRKGEVYESLEKAKHIFVSDNLNICQISREFELEFLNKEKKSEFIPCCMTSTILFTIAWLNDNRSGILQKISKLKFSSYCYSLLNPSPQILERFYAEMKKKIEGDNPIYNEDLVTFIKSSKNTEIAIAEKDSKIEKLRIQSEEKEKENKRLVKEQESKYKKFEKIITNIVICFSIVGFIAKLGKKEYH